MAYTSRIVWSEEIEDTVQQKNRIENNIQSNRDDLTTEISDRSAAVATEAATRGAADTALSNRVTTIEGKVDQDVRANSSPVFADLSVYSLNSLFGGMELSNNQFYHNSSIQPNTLFDYILAHLPSFGLNGHFAVRGSIVSSLFPSNPLIVSHMYIVNTGTKFITFYGVYANGTVGTLNVQDGTTTPTVNCSLSW